MNCLLKELKKRCRAEFNMKPFLSLVLLERHPKTYFLCLRIKHSKILKKVRSQYHEKTQVKFLMRMLNTSENSLTTIFKGWNSEEWSQALDISIYEAQLYKNTWLSNVYVVFAKDLHLAFKKDNKKQKWSKLKSHIFYYWQDLQKGIHSN